MYQAYLGALPANTFVSSLFKIYLPSGNHFRELFGQHAGWANSVSFFEENRC